MPQINWTRLIIGGLVAALIMFVTDGSSTKKLSRLTGRQYTRV
jgi:hypothetical protein